MTTFVTTSYYQATGRHPIRWCGKTINFFHGCKEASEGCANCYAAAEALHQTTMNQHSPYAHLAIARADGHPRWTGIVEPSDSRTWLKPFRTTAPALFFANSMSDPFHEGVSDDLLLHFFRTLYLTRWHTWQVLTKRAQRLRAFMSRMCLRGGMLSLARRSLPPDEQYVIPNVWVGVTAENQRRADERIPELLQVRAFVRFVSVEPMLERIELAKYLPGLHWVIVGGESAGPTGACRPFEPEWGRHVRDQCLQAGVAFFLKDSAGDSFGRRNAPGTGWEQLPVRPRAAVPLLHERRALARWAETALARILPARAASASPKVGAAHFTAKSCNRKLGPVIQTPGNARDHFVPVRPFVCSTSTSIDATCSDACPFKKTDLAAGGCYAEAGFTKFGMQRLDAVGRHLTPEQVIAEEVRRIDGAFGAGRIPADGARGGRDLRLHVGGDVGSAGGARLLAGAATRWRERGGGAVWTYTHDWRVIPRADWGSAISVLASVEKPEDIEVARQAGYPSAIVVERFFGDRAFRLPESTARVLPCPAETRSATCIQCRLCLDRDLLKLNVAIALALHGPGGGAASKALLHISGRGFE